MIDIKGSFKTIKPYTWHADKGYLLVFFKDRVLCVNTGISDAFTGKLKVRDILKIDGLFILSFSIIGFILATFIRASNIDSNLKGIIGSITVLGAIIIASIIAGRYRGKIVKQQAKKPQSIELDFLIYKSFDEIIALDKDNHEILYCNILRIKMNNSHFNWHARRAGELCFFYGDKKENFNIEINENYDQCREIVISVLSDKLLESRIN